MFSKKIFHHSSLIIILILTFLLAFALNPALAQETDKKQPKRQKKGSVHIVFPFGKLKAPKHVQFDDGEPDGRRERKTIQPSAVSTVMQDGFETSRAPSIGAPDIGPDLWNVYTINGFDNHVWDEESVTTARTGSWSLWCADVGTPPLSAGTDDYANDMHTWAIYGPFDLSDAVDGMFRFYFKGKTESNFDFFRALVSSDGSNFYGNEWSGDYSSAWEYVSIDLGGFNGMQFSGQSQVWIAFVFSSDASNTDDGIWIDDVYIQKATSSSTPQNSRLFKSNSSGVTTTFVPSYSDTDGANDLKRCHLLVRTISTATSNAVHLYYNPINNLLYLQNDAGNNYGTGFTPGATATLSNSQCTVDVSQVKVMKTQTKVKLEIPIRFLGKYAGAKNLYLYCEDRDSNTDGWDYFGTYTVTNEAPTLVKLIPNSGSGNTQTFTASFDDLNGSRDFRYLYLKVSDSIGQQASCAYFRYRRASNKIDLRSDMGGSWYGGYVIGSANTLQNSQVSVDVSTIAATSTTDTNLVLTLPLQFKPAFIGQHNVYMNTLDMSYATPGWTLMKYWRVPGDPTAPTNVSVSPSSGSGGWKTFDVTFADANGPDDLRYLYFKVNATQGNANCAYVRYDHDAGTIDLRNNAGSGWIAGGAIGSPGTVSNGQVSINRQFVTVSTAVDNMTLRVPMVFDSSFNGAKNLYLYCVDTTSLNSGWQDKGNFTVTAAAPPAGEKSHSVSLSGVEILPGSRIFLNDYVDTDGEATWWVDGRRLRKVNPSYRFTEDGLYSLALRVIDSDDNRILSGNDLFVGERLLRAGDLVGWTGSKRSLHDRSVMKITDIRKKDRIIRLRGRLIPGVRLVSGRQGSHDSYFVECREGDTPERWSWVLGRELAGEELILASRTIRPSDSVRMLEVVIDPREGTFTAMLDGKRLFPKRLVLEHLRGSVELSVPKQTTDLDIILSRKVK